MQMKMVVIKMVVRQWERDQPRITRIARMYANGVVSNRLTRGPGVVSNRADENRAPNRELRE